MLRGATATFTPLIFLTTTMVLGTLASMGDQFTIDTLQGIPMVGTFMAAPTHIQMGSTTAHTVTTQFNLTGQPFTI